MIYFHDIDPIAISLGPIKVHWYGIMYLLGFTAAWWLGRKRIAAGRLPGVDANGFSDLLFYAMLGVVVGGRVGYMLFYATAEFLHNPLLLFKVWDGGIACTCSIPSISCPRWCRWAWASAASATSSAPSCGASTPMAPGAWCSRAACRRR